METKIELTPEQIEAIELQMAGRITMFGASQRQRELLSDVLEAAEELMLALDRTEERMKPEEDLIEWYYDRYKKQLSKKGE